MKIWVDADACPKAIKEIIYRAAVRKKILTTLVANQPLSFPRSEFIRFIQVEAGFDIADSRIIKEMEAGDLVITADIPLADLVIKKAGAALNPRGELYSESNIRQRLAIRNLNESLRSSGLIMSGPPKLNAKNHHDFANSLDRLLNKIAP